MSRLAEEYYELKMIPQKPYIGLELRTVPNTVDVYNIVAIKKYDTSGSVIKDYHYSDLETPYYGTENAIKKVMEICGVSQEDVFIM